MSPRHRNLGFRARPLFFSLALLVLLASVVRAEITIVLQNGFIDHYKRRVTIDTQYTVDKAHKHPNPAKKDGDLHIAGRAEEVKLPIVAEIMNAKDAPEAVKLIHDVEGTGETVPLSGAWRLWCEHGGDSDQIQGDPLDPFTTTNPPHVFEIHPITRLKDFDLLSTLKPIKGFDTKDAHDAFTKYESIRCRIIPGENTTTLVTTMAGYNYVEFIMELNSTPKEVDDGLMVYCKVRDLNDELLVRNRRMVMVKDSAVEKHTRGKLPGTKLHVLGLPRIDLSLVAWRVKTAAEGRTEVLTWGLPYEIIVVGFYEYVADEADAQPAPAKKRAIKSFIPHTLSPEDLKKHKTPRPPDDTRLDCPPLRIPAIRARPALAHECTLTKGEC